MLRTAFLTLVVLAIALGGGTASVWYVLEELPAFGIVRIGEWTASPHFGTPDAGPYVRARFAREGGIPLGQSEGIAFTATRDSGGAPLRRECSYHIEGPFPSARLWTLYAAAPSGEPLPSFARRRPALHSRMLLRQPDNGFTITVAPKPAAGNWLATGGSGPMHLVLTLLDTPVSTGLQLGQPQMPEITRTECDV
ncbi:DUF1214 domain-containing protein [Chelativorans sp. YIM 93263]|uniref:DUF1214 domain-containing protein n=1 Tax=Chelativorans sp. YIM 93263 TaxID=2906648 RepID=UPI002377E074|nr:DUF1214 domain-containing protein [Chelativorans sp. YIM 93263]